MQPRDGLHEMRRGMIAEIRADVSDSQSAIRRRARGIDVVFVEEGHLDGAEEAVLGGDVFPLVVSQRIEHAVVGMDGRDAILGQLIVGDLD